jgi:hypothetical protein
MQWYGSKAAKKQVYMGEWLQPQEQDELELLLLDSLTNHNG